MSSIWLFTIVAGTTVLLWEESFLRLWVGERYYPGPAAILMVMLMVLQFALIRTDANIIDLTLNLREEGASRRALGRSLRRPRVVLPRPDGHGDHRPRPRIHRGTHDPERELPADDRPAAGHPTRATAEGDRPAGARDRRALRRRERARRRRSRRLVAGPRPVRRGVGRGRRDPRVLRADCRPRRGSSCGIGSARWCDSRERTSGARTARCGWRSSRPTWTAGAPSERWRSSPAGSRIGDTTSISC